MPTTYAKFKFHYDSINSKDALVTQYAELKFKFHYDSINSYSYLLSRHLKPNLNSIMILLIQELQEKYDLLDENLNSIMILLIPKTKITVQALRKI